jgi:hypothetical protein
VVEAYVDVDERGLGGLDEWSCLCEYRCGAGSDDF